VLDPIGTSPQEIVMTHLYHHFYHETHLFETHVIKILIQGILKYRTLHRLICSFQIHNTILLGSCEGKRWRDSIPRNYELYIQEN